MPYWQLFYHLVWTTKNRQPLLSPEVEPRVYALLRNKAASLQGRVFALGGTDDHVHMVVSVPPKIALATFVGQVKGASSARFNQAETGGSQLYWQEEYGAFSFDGMRLHDLIAYVETQKQHHQNGTTLAMLERTEEAARPALCEASDLYAMGDAVLEQELDSLRERGVADSV